MSADGTVQIDRVDDDRVRVGSDGILAAIVFVTVSALLIATLPAPQPGEQAEERPVVHAAAPPAGPQP